MILFPSLPVSFSVLLVIAQTLMTFFVLFCFYMTVVMKTLVARCASEEITERVGGVGGQGLDMFIFAYFSLGSCMKASAELAGVAWCLHLLIDLFVD